MSRSERYIPSAKKMEQAVQALRRQSERRTTRRNTLARALARSKKATLVDLLLHLIDAQEELGLWLEEQLNIEKEVADATLDIESDIAKASYVPERLINYNFPYEYAAYERIERGLRRLVERGELRVAMDLSEKLMKAGSYQVAMSDEGGMSEDIVRCLRVVAEAVNASAMEVAQKETWYGQMGAADEVGFLWDAVCRKRP